jgi:hypothetical protein
MMEKEASEVDGNWAETKGYGYIGGQTYVGK